MPPTRVLRAIVGTLACSFAAFVAAPSSGVAQSSSAADQRLSNCDHYMASYARSAARKLGRAVAGQRYQTPKLPSKSDLELKVGSDDRSFEILFEKHSTAAGVVDASRRHRRTYTMIDSDHGPVVTRHRWPSRKAIGAGDKACRPISSDIAFPDVPVADIDVKPFKFWGLRVVWHLPTQPGAEVVQTAPMDALKAAIAATEQM